MARRAWPVVPVAALWVQVGQVPVAPWAALTVAAAGRIAGLERRAAVALLAAAAGPAWVVAAVVSVVAGAVALLAAAVVGLAAAVALGASLAVAVEEAVGLVVAAVAASVAAAPVGLAVGMAESVRRVAVVAVAWVAVVRSLTTQVS
jgi:hypothetical protein